MVPARKPLLERADSRHHGVFALGANHQRRCSSGEHGSKFSSSCFSQGDCCRWFARSQRYFSCPVPLEIDQRRISPEALLGAMKHTKLWLIISIVWLAIVVAAIPFILQM